MEWILLAVFTFPGYYGDEGGLIREVTTTEFSSRPRCEAARAVLNDSAVDNQGLLRAECLKR